MNDVFQGTAAVDVGLGPIVGVALHAAHRVRPEMSRLLAVSELDRLREEDPYADVWAAVVDVAVIARCSRFEVDLNRVRERAVYLEPGDAWGLHVWQATPSNETIERSLALYDAFYAGMRVLLDAVLERHGRFFLLDVHSYNHRRAGRDMPAADARANPELNLGTAGVHRSWAPLVARYGRVMAQAEVGGRPLDVRENVRFRGGCFMRWVNGTYGRAGCAVTLEWKKTYMDEWTGRADPHHVAEIASACARGAQELREALRTA